MISLKNIKKGYQMGSNFLPVLKGIDINITDGELVSIMGSSGSGKSTLLNIIGILDNLDTGEYHLDDMLIKDLTETRAAQIRSQYIGFVFQSFNLIPFKNAWENVALPLYYQGVPRKEREQRAVEMLASVGLEEWSRHMPNEMSGGQKQRVAIARAMISKPKLILADEPTGALDSATSEQVMDLLTTVNKKNGITVVIVTHEREIAEMTDRLIYLRDGLIESQNALADPKIADKI